MRNERTVGGRIRKYYSATEDGLATLEEVKVKIRELNEEVLGHRDPTLRRSRRG